MVTEPSTTTAEKKQRDFSVVFMKKLGGAPPPHRDYTHGSAYGHAAPNHVGALKEESTSDLLTPSPLNLLTP